MHLVERHNLNAPRHYFNALFLDGILKKFPSISYLSRDRNPKVALKLFTVTKNKQPKKTLADLPESLSICAAVDKVRLNVAL
jgi:hypothetical protein